MILREIIERCPMDEYPIGQDKCDNCKYRGMAWKTKMKGKPYKYTIKCNFLKGNGEKVKEK